jgi:hypothetical protein
MAPAAGFEPATSMLTASCATAAPRRTIGTWIIIPLFRGSVNASAGLLHQANKARFGGFMGAFEADNFQRSDQHE